VLAVAFFSKAALPAQAQAADTGWYVGVTGGSTFLDDTELTDSTAPIGVVGIDASWRTGFHVGVVGGYRFTKHLRAELELTYRRNEIDTLTVTETSGAQSESGRGRFESFCYIGNVWLDLDFGKLPVVPYVGGGIGLAAMEINLKPVESPTSGTVFLTDGEDTAGVVAYQVGAGIAYPVNAHVTLSLDYRYFVTEDPDFNFTGVSGEYRTHNAGATLRYQF
jgi:opacity protein-like surface antigen